MVKGPYLKGVHLQKFFGRNRRFRHLVRRFRRNRGGTLYTASRWLRKNYKRLPSSLVNKILRRPGHGMWRSRGTGLIKRKGKFTHYWSLRGGHRIRRRGHKGWYSKAAHKSYKRRRARRRR